MTETASDLLQAEKAFQYLQQHPVLGPVVLRWGICPLRPGTDYFGELCRSVLAQQISGQVAQAIFERLDVLCAGLRPESLALFSIEDLRAVGISARKAQTLLELAKRCQTGDIPLPDMGIIAEQEIRSQLTSVKGIGNWTVDMFLIFALNRPRVVPGADFGIRKAIQKLYGLAALPAVGEVSGYYREWVPFETVASWYLWRSLDNPGRV